MICDIDSTVNFRCRLNHLGDGDFYVIVAGKYLKKLNKSLGQQVSYTIKEDPEQLGVDIPEVLIVLLEQDSNLKEIFDNLTDGKKRSLIYGIIRIKDIDKQIKLIIEYLQNAKMK